MRKVLCGILFIGMSLIVGCNIVEKRGRIPISSKEICRREVFEIEKTFEELGYTDIELIELKDIEKEEDKELNGIIQEISINGETNFEAKQSFALSSRIKIKYHSYAEDRLPIISSEAKGKSYDEIIELFDKSNFWNIDTKIVKDTDRDNVLDCEVECIEIENDQDYSLGEIYSIDTKITICYSYIEEQLPITSAEAKGKTKEDILALFKETKFLDVIVVEENDLDKDNILTSEVERIEINEQSDFDIEKTYPINSKIVIYYSITEYDVSVKLECKENFIFNTYGINVYLGNKKLGTLGHGKTKTFKLELPAGKYDLILKSKDDSSVQGCKTFNIKKDRTLRYTADCQTDAVKMKYMKELEIPYVNSEAKGKNVDDIVSAYKSVGYKSVTKKALNDLAASELSKSNIVSEIKIGSSKKFTKDSVYYADSKVVVYYHCGKKVSVPIDSYDAKGQNQQSIVQQFKDAGFMNVTPVIYTGSYGDKVRNNEVQGVKIGGSSSFSAKDKKALDAKVEVYYYAISYLPVTMNKLLADLKANAYNAKDYYEECYVAVTGRVGSIDASGKYISLSPQYSFENINCNITSKDQKQMLSKISVGKTVTIKGKITGVGEVLGYNLDIHEIYP